MSTNYVHLECSICQQIMYIWSQINSFQTEMFFGPSRLPELALAASTNKGGHYINYKTITTLFWQYNCTFPAILVQAVCVRQLCKLWQTNINSVFFSSPSPRCYFSEILHGRGPPPPKKATFGQTSGEMGCCRGEIITWWSEVFTQCPPYATVL